MEIPKKRVFLAIPASEQIQKQFENFKAEHNTLPVNWHQPKNLHITLLPPVEVLPEELEILRETLKKFEPQNPFEIIFNLASTGPSHKSPRLIWTTGEATPEILILKQKLEQLVNYKPDRNFQMHITLARFNEDDTHNTALHNFLENIHWHMLVDKFVIMESNFNGQKSDYRILKEFPFYV